MDSLMISACLESSTWRSGVSDCERLLDWADLDSLAERGQDLLQDRRAGEESGHGNRRPPAPDLQPHLNHRLQGD